MAYSPHVLLAFGGTLGNNSQEIWTCTLKLMGQFEPNDTMTLIEQAEFAAAAVTPLSAWFNSADASISEDARLAWVKCNSVGSDGRYIWNQTTQVDVNPVVRGKKQVQVSWRQSYAITLRTLSSRGPASRGRFYPPMVTPVPASGSPYVSAPTATAMANAAVTLLEDLSTISVGESNRKWQVCNASSINGMIGPIRRVEVDRIADTQRRRTNRIPRESVEVPVAIPA